MQGVEIAEPGRGLHLGRHVPSLQPVDLVQRDHDRHPELEDASCDEAVAGADALARRQHEQDSLDVFERGVDRALHVLRQRVERPLKPREVREHELVVVAVGDPEDPPPGRLRLVRDDRHLAAAEGVDERRLADVRPAGDGDETRFQAGRSHVSGNSSAAE
jgi:hypothetical protein